MHNVHLEADERVSQRDRDVRVQVITFALELRMSVSTKMRCSRNCRRVATEIIVLDLSNGKHEVSGFAIDVWLALCYEGICVSVAHARLDLDLESLLFRDEPENMFQDESGVVGFSGG